MCRVAELRQTQVGAQSFHDGTLLQDLAHQHHRNFSNFLSAQHGNLDGVVTWGSQCSGSEGADFVMTAAQNAFNLSGKDVVFQQEFACENSEEKRKWIDFIINTKRRQQGKEPICIFCDILDMGNSTAKCWVHQKDCKVPDVNILLVSTSCKDLSRLSNGSKAKKGMEKHSAHAKYRIPVLAQDHSPGGSADTYRGGLLNYIDKHHVDIIIYENSDVLADDGGGDKGGGNQSPDSVQNRTNHDVFNTDMLTRGFQGKSFVLNSKVFGLPQNRNRLRVKIGALGAIRSLICNL